MSKLLSQGGFGCVYYPAIKCNGKSDTKKKTVSKLQVFDYNSVNEMVIGNLVMSISSYFLFFLPVVSSCPIKLNSIDERLLKKCDFIVKDAEAAAAADKVSDDTDSDDTDDTDSDDVDDDDKKEYILMEIPYVKNKTFYSILIDMYSSKKHIFVGLIETYSYLLEAISILIDKRIVHFDIKSENILYNLETNLPLLLDFGISIIIDNFFVKNVNGNKLNYEKLKQIFYVFSPDYYIWAPEIHVISFLLQETDGVLTEKDVIGISTEYVEFNKGLINFSDGFKEDYLKICIEYLRRFVGMDREKTISELLSFYPTWDNFSLSILYLKTFYFMFPKGFHRNSLILFFSQMLLFNIHPDPRRRYTLEETKQKFKDIFFMEENVENYIDLLTTFDYDVGYATKVINVDINNMGHTRAMMKLHKK